MRLWNSTQTDDGSKAPLGNGDLLVYQSGPDITHIYGVPFSMPSWGTISLNTNETSYECKTERRPQTAIYKHSLTVSGQECAIMNDFVASDTPAFLRIIDCNNPFTLTLTPDKQARGIPLKNYIPSDQRLAQDALLYVFPQANIFNHVFVNPDEKSVIVAVEGNATLQFDPETKSTQFHINPGKSVIYIVAGEYFPDVTSTLEDVLKLTPEELLNKTQQYWENYAAKRRNTINLIPGNHPESERVSAAIDSVATLIKAQQSSTGGVMAGHIYNMAYVRDMSGVYRGLMAVGHTAEAKAILDFWWKTFETHGDIFNAEGMGNISNRLRFPNDEVEVPGYILMNFLHYAETTGDWGYIRQVFPLLEWAMEVQFKHLYGGMLGFSGDETYIAGGMYPAYLVDHGSAESTMLMITGGQRLLNAMDHMNLGVRSQRDWYRKKIAEARSQYHENFVVDDVLYTNNPKRVDIADHPRSVFGFCQAKMVLEDELDLRWCERNAEGYYVCPEKRDVAMPPRTRKRFVMNSISLAMFYHHTDLFSIDELATLASPGFEAFEITGGVASEVGNNRTLGYDYGFMLYSLSQLNHPLADRALTKMLDVIDPTGAWVEFYTDDIPTGCRSRPWESGINLEAILNYFKKQSVEV